MVPREVAYYPIWFAKIKKMIQKHHLKLLQPYGLSSVHAMYLMILKFHPDGLTPGELSAHLDVDKANTSRVLKVLEEKEFTIRKYEAGSNTKYRELLTKRGLEVAECIHRDMKQMHNRFASVLTEEEITVIRNIVQKVSVIAEQMEKDGREIE